ncbi:hypothetical protein EDD86DRAFT_226161 [Gorgonomyces haynaldii]|nr:hypothetical protein EDD86DRAFT_226161 [Gorgonomyces haynaldii]
MESQLELIRQTHEEIDQLERASVSQLLKKSKQHRDQLLQEHRVNGYLTNMAEKSKFLVELYKDKTGTLKDEIATTNSAQEFVAFYQRLKTIKEHFKATGNESVRAFNPDQLVKDAEFEQNELEALFTGEEGLGRHLDLNALYLEYLNLKNVPEMSYIRYIAEYDRFKDMDKQLKTQSGYPVYLSHLVEYLLSFYARSQPLYDLKGLEQRTREEFEAMWSKGQVPGWLNSNQTELYCNACKKLFAKQTLFDAHLNGKKHKKALLQQDQAEQTDTQKETAWLEFFAVTLTGALKVVRNDTRSYVERKQTLTEIERMEEVEQEPVEVDVSDEEGDEKLYNPLKLPIGWDGKPIPYWLFKLHGLGIQHPCEICGGYVYMGRKAFERHFQEWRHAHGLKCLGIQNSRLYYDITKIEDAINLAETLMKREKDTQSYHESLEEYEDADGNVFSKKTYLDMKRQGLL